jgi:hypothetical protein
MSRILFAAALAASVGSAQAAEAPGLSVTIYNSNVALVQDVRNLSVGAGRQRLEFKDVSAAIRPETVSLSGRGLSVVEQNFDFDLLTPQKLMEKAVGQEIQIVRINPGTGQETTETATVLSANQGVVLRIGERIEVLRDDGVPTRVRFARLPENLRAQPTLSVLVDADRAGERQTSLSYLTRGLSWKADYVAMFDEPKGAIDFQGWITLTNSTGSAFKDAQAQLVAGEVALTDGPRPFRQPPNPRAFGGAAGMETSSQDSVGDFYVYPLKQRTSIENNQTKQVGFLTAQGASARKAYQYRTSLFQSLENAQAVDTVLMFSNAAQSGLGAPLPAGVVRVYMRDAAGEAKFIGENSIGHTPQGSQIALKTGEAFDVTVRPTLISREPLSRSWFPPFDIHRYRVSYTVRNARSEPVEVEVRQDGLWRETRLIQESVPSRRVDYNTLSWTVTVPAGGETVLTATVETR